MSVRWDASLASGDAEIDGQHREILRRLEDLVTSLQAGRRQEIGKLFLFLGDYVAEHFAAEERAMERTGFPGRTVHAAAHARFVREYAELRLMYEEVGPARGIAVRASTWIRDWLDAHVHGLDRALARHLREARDRIG